MTNTVEILKSGRVAPGGILRTSKKVRNLCHGYDLVKSRWNEGRRVGVSNECF